jgi:formylglycine-generating enzyme required for sulfatase activity
VKYYYRVKGRNGEYEGKWSDTVMITVSPNTYILSGAVTGADGVTVTLSGDATGSQTVKSGEKYSFSVIEGGNYTVAPTKTGYVFAPASKTFSSVSANGSQSFTAAKQIFTLSGKVTGANGVTVTLSGDATASQLVNNRESYSFTVQYGGNYTLTPSNTGYAFTPQSRSFTNVTANGTQDFTGTIQTFTFTLVSIPGGTFQMGDVENAGYEYNNDEKPVHKVTVSSFEMSVCEITNSQYASYLNAAQIIGDISAKMYGAYGTYSGQEYINLSGSYDSINKCWITYSGGTFSVVAGYENWPAVYVTWYGAKAFAEYYGMDLPREAEWEYACRGGKQYKYGTDDGTISSSKANYDSNIEHPVDVRKYSANPFGLYDMSGNVWEWCADWYGPYSSGSVTNPTGAQYGTLRVFRGGDWYDSGYYCRSSSRVSNTPDGRSYIVGFRVVRRVSP